MNDQFILGIIFGLILGWPGCVLANLQNKNHYQKIRSKG